MQQRLGDDDALVSFHVCDDSVIEFALTKKEMHFQEIPFSRVALDTKSAGRLRTDRLARRLAFAAWRVSRTRFYAESGGRGDRARRTPLEIEPIFRRLLVLLGELYAILFVPVLPAVVDTKRNWISSFPHGPLHRDSMGRTLDRTIICYRPAQCRLAAIGQLRPINCGSARSVKWGRHSANGRAGSSRRPVRSSRSRRRIGGRARHAQDRQRPRLRALRRPKDAFPELLRRTARPDSHGGASLLRRLGARPFVLKLAGDSGSNFLYACEVAEMSLKTQLAVLSACDTARNSVVTGDEQYGMVRSFLAAGVRSVISTLWAIEDQSAVSMFSQFYRTSTKVPLIEAVSAAQRRMMSRSPYDLPYFWAPYVLSGEWNRPLAR